MSVPVWAWFAVLAVFVLLIAADLGLSRGAERSLRGAAVLSGMWIAAGLAFGAVLWLWQGGGTAGQYLAGYLLEKSLSVDNIFVFVLLFTSLAVPAALQRRVLYLGVVGALVLRAGLIAAGGALVANLSWIFYLFGAVVLLAAVRMIRGGPGDPQRSLAVRGLRRVLPVTEDYHGEAFLVRSGGRLTATPLLVALLAIEVTDLVFALDSIPAVFGITSDVFIVFTSNAFAVLGLRALYFLLAGAVHRFTYLRHGLAVLLGFIGVKMLISPLVHLPVWVSLAVIGPVIGGAVAASLGRGRPAGQPGRSPAGGPLEPREPPEPRERREPQQAARR